MPTSGASRIVRFGVFEFAVETGDLWKAGHRIRLPEQPRQVLLMLVARPGELVTREEVRAALWPDDTFVDFDAGLNVVVNKIRHVLDDSASSPRYIETLPRRGYRFIASVESVAPRTDTGEFAERVTGLQEPTVLPGAPDETEASSRHARIWIVALGAVVLVALGVGAWWRVAGASRPSPRVTRLMITPPPSVGLTTNTGDRVFAIAPDGTRIAYIGGPAWQLYTQGLDQVEPTLLAASPATRRGPFFSPDGTWVGYFVGNYGLKKTRVTGGPEIGLCGLDGTPRGASWAPDGTIVFATANPETGLWRVSDVGGEPRLLTRPDAAAGEYDHLWPEFLPGGRAVLFTIQAKKGGPSAARVTVLDLQTGRHKVLLQGARSARYVASGHIVYAAGNDLQAIAFDVARLETRGTPVPVVPDVLMMPSQTAYFDVSHDGTLVYMPRSALQITRSLVWIDRSGREELLPSPARAYRAPRLSPDGTRVAVEIHEEQNDIWILEVNRDARKQFTSGPALDVLPLWSPNGSRLYFGSNLDGEMQTYWQAADGTGQPERVTDGPATPASISPDGAHLVLLVVGSAPDLALLRLETHDRPQPLIHTPDIENNGQISPDGRWIAYDLWRQGRPEINVRPFPDVSGGSWQVSTGGGTQPVWARNSEELFYMNAMGALMSVRVSRRGAFAVPQKVLDPRSGAFEIAGTRMYDVSPDGARFLMLKSPDGPSTPAPLSLVVVQNWFQELQQLVPVR